MKELEAKMAAEDSNGGAASIEKNAAIIKKDFEANKDAVMQMLLQNVIKVNIEVPKVIKGDFENYL